MNGAFEESALSEEVLHLVANRDYDGAEELLYQALGRFPTQSTFIHFQFGRLYGQWNKLSSALAHFNLAIESIGGLSQLDFFKAQIVAEINGDLLGGALI